MKIIQVAPNVLNLNENLTYGGIERLIIGLKKEFDNLGYQNQVLAPAGNNTISDIVPTLPESYWDSMERDENFKSAANLVFSNLAHLSNSINYINNSNVDIVHDHTGKLFPFSKSLNKPLVTTLHGPADWFWDKELYKDLFKENYFIAVSNSQAKDYEFLNPRYIVSNGLDLKSFPFNKNHKNYLFSLGQISKNKGQAIAVKAAKDLGMDLVIGGIVSDDPTDAADRAYFDNEIKPFIDGQQIKFIGALNDTQKKEVYKNAKAFLMPIDCNEAFGLVLIESLACGTPVVAYNRGAIPEIVLNGKNGFVTQDYQSFLEGVKLIDKIDRNYCRKSVLERFDISKIAKDYISVYEDAIRSSK